MRISDWSSDVCSSDLLLARGRCRRCGAPIDPLHARVELASGLIGADALSAMPGTAGWIWALLGWLLLPLALLDERHFWLERKSVVEGKRVSVSVGLGGGSVLKKKKQNKAEQEK